MTRSDWLDACQAARLALAAAHRAAYERRTPEAIEAYEAARTTYYECLAGLAVVEARAWRALSIRYPRPAPEGEPGA